MQCIIFKLQLYKKNKCWKVLFSFLKRRLQLQLQVICDGCSDGYVDHIDVKLNLQTHKRLLHTNGLKKIFKK